MKKRNNLIILVYIMLIGFCTNKMQGQILEFYKPIIVSCRAGVLNNEKVDLGIFDYFKQDISKMKYEYLKYDSDKESLFQYDDVSKSYQNIIYFKSENFIFQEKIKLGIFNEFNLTQENSKKFIASSPYGKYPSHSQVIKSIEVLQKTKKNLILKINYQDEFEWKYFGILVLTDYKYEKLEDDE
ncbi:MULTISPECIES: hypothetical protein [unclassified Chryseobacterium]|uniref:hypothetical protein n=1 Tax=unclassified Chryseobacterium TaxID=2593645 RepID=UPI00100B3804|nr:MULTISPECIES: hypothetical protein [unclassified Chryseobacterium]RXM49629.1 hypothetical protein BOQ64_22770 [Chryseobacterium sp. CH25]RXM61523.1 hypothetical protein BOQ60_23360 [Chryseobacterium sp. CH1]